MKLAIIDYGSGNLRSAAKSIERAGRQAGLSLEVMVTSNPTVVSEAERIVLPGVGAFGDCAAGLKAVPGMWQALEDVVLNQGKPFLGICVGMQLMADRGLEHGNHEGFGWIPGEVIPIKPEDSDLKIPHMGWNTLEICGEHALLDELEGAAEPHAYFVHSYHFQPKNLGNRYAITHYGSEITAVVGHDNMIGTQFHPEKSQKVGLTFLQHFLEWRP
jgi:glutamine amidotransferase